MNIESKIVDYVREWTLDFANGERESLGQIYEDNRDYVDRQLLEFTDVVRDVLSDTVAMVVDDWKSYRSSDLYELLTFEKFVSARDTNAARKN
jgi:hypothetical protein